MEKDKETSIEIQQHDLKTEQMIDKKDIISVEDLFKKDITYRDLPEAVKEYFQQFLDKVPKIIANQKTQIEIIQRLKNILTTGYIRDILFEHIVKVKDKYKDSDTPEEWVRQINPTIFTKLKQMMDTQSNEMLELFDTAGLDEDFDKIEKVTLTRIMKERKLIKDKKVDNKIVEGKFEVLNDGVDKK